MRRKDHPMYGVWKVKRRYTRARLEEGRPGILPEPWYSDFWRFVEDFPPRPEHDPPDGSAFWVMDRVDNDGQYVPGNTQWLTAREHSTKTFTKDVDTSAVQLLRYEDPTEREKQRAATRRRWEDPAEREKQRAATRRRWEDPAEREKMSAAIQAAHEAMPVLTCLECGYQGKKQYQTRHRKPRKNRMSTCDTRQIMGGM